MITVWLPMVGVAMEETNSGVGVVRGDAVVGIDTAFFALPTRFVPTLLLSSALLIPFPPGVLEVVVVAVVVVAAGDPRERGVVLALGAGRRVVVVVVVVVVGEGALVRAPDDGGVELGSRGLARLVLLLFGVSCVVLSGPPGTLVARRGASAPGPSVVPGPWSPSPAARGAAC